MKKLNKTGLLALGVAAMTLSGAAMAEPLGLLNGRSADVSRSPDKSVEAGAVFGEFDDVDYTFFGARFNYKVNPLTVAYVDLGQAEYDFGADFDGLAYGLGGFYQMDGVLDNTDFGIHASLHKTSLENSRFSGDVSVTSIMVEALFSGREAVNSQGTLFWNASVGLNRTSGEGDSDTELALGAGLTMPTASQSGEFFAGVMHIDDLGFGAGYRHFLK
ncbi:hypothetical protein ACUNV4_02480 [Granulosicoccus sp. 3-233]|uniref:hypothetical protein n=1 Tax=Granulosicoccus sp. 3-233 TaxID=3417969 RepID=UPI003D32D43C